jgi:hypothetical protein
LLVNLALEASTPHPKRFDGGFPSYRLNAIAKGTQQ